MVSEQWPSNLVSTVATCQIFHYFTKPDIVYFGLIFSILAIQNNLGMRMP